MKIALVALEFPPAVGGMASYAGCLTDMLAQRGHAVQVLAPELGEPAHQQSDGATITPCLTGRYATDVRRIRRHVAVSAPDVVLLANAGFAGIATDLDIPVVARTVGNDVYAAWIGPRVPLRFLYWRLPHGPGSVGGLLRRLDQEHRLAAVLRGLRCCAAVICNSGYTRNRLRELGVPDAALEVVPGGVDTSLFSPRQQPGAGVDRSGRERGAGIVVGAAGGLSPIKGFSVAIDALAELAPRWPNLSLVLAGNGPERAALERQATCLGVGGRVTFRGAVPLQEMPGFYRSLEVYLQPSVLVYQPASGVPREESMGRAICEAQACGVPVVASRCGGIPEVMQDGLTGFLVRPSDAGALAGAIERLLRQPELIRRMGEAGRALVRDRFSWKAVVSATEAQLAAAVRTRRSS